MEKIIFTAIYAAIGLYILYRMLWRKDPLRDEYEKLYNEILTSSKYKVKGQYDKD